MFGPAGCAADGTMAAKNPISNLVDAILDNRAQGRGEMGMGMHGGAAQMAQMERAFAEGQAMARGGRMNPAMMGPAMMDQRGQAFMSDFGMAGPKAAMGGVRSFLFFGHHSTLTCSLAG